MGVCHTRVARKQMNTTFDFVVSCDARRAKQAQTVLLHAHTCVRQLEQELSEFLPHSAVSRLNQATVDERLPVPTSVLQLLELSAQMESLSAGAFDCAIKGARRVRPAFGWDAEQGTAWRRGENEKLSFAAIGKGFALEMVRMQLAQEDFTDFHLSAGGSSLILSGFSAPQEPWTFGWAWKKDTQGDWLGIPLLHESGETIAIGVSGICEQGFHVRDPRTGKPASGTQTALVALPRAAEADALSTALFVSGWEQGCERLSAGSETPALAVIDHQGCPSWNGRFQKLWGKIATTCLTLWLPIQAFADDEVDLADLGFSDFTPYTVTRDPLWIALPLLALVLVLVHLKNNRPEKKETLK
jgi:FAD:protein FMN transferase